MGRDVFYRRPAPSFSLPSLRQILISQGIRNIHLCMARVKRYAWGPDDSSRAGEALMADDNKPLTMTVPEARHATP